RLCPVGLEEDVVADGIDEGPEAAGRLQATLATQGREDAQKRLLGHVFDGRGRPEARPQLEPEQPAEVRREVTFGRGVAGRQALDVLGIELETRGQSQGSTNVTAPDAFR